MLFLNDKERIKDFKEYCYNNYCEEEAKVNFKLFMSTMLELDIEAELIRLLNPSKTYKSTGLYTSDTIIILEMQNPLQMKLLTDFFDKLNNVNVEDVCIIYRQKTNVIINDSNKALYCNMLFKELNFFKSKYVLNFSCMKIETLQCDSNVINIGYDFLNNLSKLFYKEKRTNDEISLLNKMIKKVFPIFREIDKNSKDGATKC